MILVTGATGNVGRQVVSQLANRGVQARALTRDPHSANFAEDVEVVAGDLSDPGGLKPHLGGARSFREWARDHADDFARAERVGR